mmetsp:Transcript_4062/g.5983  ORF Transcript_4062/g.5983 Transcript_4062/m.5983 type:complete len:172 (-) Transcript_4062:98-613(-)
MNDAMASILPILIIMLAIYRSQGEKVCPSVEGERNYKNLRKTGLKLQGNRQYNEGAECLREAVRVYLSSLNRVSHFDMVRYMETHLHGPASINSVHTHEASTFKMLSTKASSNDMTADSEPHKGEEIDLFEGKKSLDENSEGDSTLFNGVPEPVVALGYRRQLSDARKTPT